MALTRDLSKAAVEARSWRVSAELQVIAVGETYKTELTRHADAIIQFGLAVRRIPIRAEVPRVGWCPVGRAMFVPPRHVVHDDRAGRHLRHDAPVL